MLISFVCAVAFMVSGLAGISASLVDFSEDVIIMQESAVSELGQSDKNWLSILFGSNVIHTFD